MSASSAPAQQTGDGGRAMTIDSGNADDEDNGATNAPDDDAPTAQNDIEVAADSQDDGYTVAAYGEVEVTLVELDPELEQLCDGFLEPLDGDGQVDETGNAVPDARLGVRLGYRVSYDPNTDSLEHVVFFPVRSNPTTAQYARVPTAVLRALPVVVLNAQRPLQLRAEGVLKTTAMRAITLAWTQRPSNKPIQCPVRTFPMAWFS
jgi:putative ATP-dependent endonuclease of OLD family